ncbi:MAG TPA: hypothetical protein VG269_14845 [Tepidisphaeraceae bacterium]|jgi:hypothetical protein|nr:hypothetical protein [Tepidisphaeraceae bacterium]
MDTISSNGGSPEPIPTSPNPIPQAAPGPEETAAACDPGAQPDAQSPADNNAIAAPVPVDVQPVAHPTLPLTKGLSAQQQTALAALASGKLPTAAARAAGVVASTLYRWRKQDPAFIAALNAWRNYVQEAGRDRVLAMIGQATATVMTVMQQGDARTALVILKGLGVITPVPPGPESPEGVHRANDRDNYRRYLDVQRERFQLRKEHRAIVEHPIGNALDEGDRQQDQLEADKADR